MRSAIVFSCDDGKLNIVDFKEYLEKKKKKTFEIVLSDIIFACF